MSDIQDKLFNNTFSPMLANRYNGQDIIGYYMSEKLDGYRALFYNGTEPIFLSRNNKPFHAPKWFVEEIGSKLPEGMLLDGELYTNRGDFRGMGIVRKKNPIDSEWENIRYMVFDLPLVNRPFYERYDIMIQLIQNIPYVELVEHILIENKEQFNTTYKSLIKQGAEGIMLRNPNSYYEQKRSSNLLKVKEFLDDEVIVESMQYGNGKHSNVMGNLIVKWAKHSPNSKIYTDTFHIGSGFTDEERENWKTLFKKGTLLTIQYFELTNTGKPRFPTFQNIYYKV
jgi:DNA ligase 1